ncbi:hypothetical protein AVEN_182628-1 [Araneus ventricosus]|uniref:Integrase catalytic domain-containing protein n=1 Tax=Araneus ventricosus TaxID=182803 RepID=A0A4Y2KBM7_ARAVE|nr:hypothetical protein AVEN_182628-1 [Araneus ventricosus]
MYKLCTVTYGTTSAPFLATRTVQQLAKDEGKDFPLASSVLLQDVYMDGVLTGEDNLIKAKDMQQQLISMFDKGGMELHKWSANNQSLLCDEMKESDYSFSQETKTLGILWKPQPDCFGFNLVIEQSEVYTKRAVLSQIARIFDPLGLLGPIITKAKMFLQKLWFISNCRNPESKRKGPLTSEELSKAEHYLIKQCQFKVFSTEVTAMMSGDNISNKSKILNLSAFLDNKGVMRVGGRLENSQLPYSGKHPIILPSKGKLTEMIVKYYHEKYFHLGPQHLLFQIRQKYCPIHGRNVCRKIVHNCVVCFKVKPKEYSQKMGNLPKERIIPDKVFSSTGIDLCGPFLIKNKYQRKGPEIKVFVCIFICLVTKATHLEIISDLTSQSLIATLKRFISRRGKCHKIFSDNGSNMVGANRALRDLNKLVRDRNESLYAFFAEENIEWSFIPPRSPNWEGLREANIKAIKYHFKRVAGNSKFSYEELLTLTTQIEAILNSRPLTPFSADVDDLEILTPAHFLIGRPITQ